MNIFFEKDLTIVRKYLQDTVKDLEIKCKSEIGIFLYSRIYRAIMIDRMDIFEVLVNISDDDRV